MTRTISKDRPINQPQQYVLGRADTYVWICVNTNSLLIVDD